MCGIVGYVNTASSEAARSETIAAMCETIIHRGPNDMGMYVEGPVGLGMRRLSVIDLNSGHQPIANETKTVWVVFNGEIYNFQELAKDLKRRGHQFQTASDTEVIVHLYEELEMSASIISEVCSRSLSGMRSALACYWHEIDWALNLSIIFGMNVCSSLAQSLRHFWFILQ